MPGQKNMNMSKMYFKLSCLKHVYNYYMYHYFIMFLTVIVHDNV